MEQKDIIKKRFKKLCEADKGIGQRKFAGDFRRIISGYAHLVKSILMYGEKIQDMLGHRKSE